MLQLNENCRTVTSSRLEMESKRYQFSNHIEITFHVITSMIQSEKCNILSSMIFRIYFRWG